MHAARCLWIGAAMAAVAILLGAFGAHVLEKELSAHDLDVFEKAVRYQMYHALGLCLCGLLAAHHPSRAQRLAARGFVFGTVLFSGSLYLLVGTGVTWLGAVTPLGGVLFVVGWIALAVAGRDLGRG